MVLIKNFSSKKNSRFLEKKRPVFLGVLIFSEQQKVDFVKLLGKW